MTPLERAARALARFSVQSEAHFPYISKTEAERSWQAYVPQAKAVLEAIREPSEAMVRLGGCRMDDGGDSDAVLVWQAMIDAALTETGKQG